MTLSLPAAILDDWATKEIVSRQSLADDATELEYDAAVEDLVDDLTAFGRHACRAYAREVNLSYAELTDEDQLTAATEICARAAAYRVAAAELATESKALPNGTGTVYSDPIDLGNVNGRPPAGIELKISAPALTTADLPDGETMLYQIQHAADAAFTSPASLYGVVLTQTGAGGAGAAAATKRIQPPSDCGRYVRVAATNSGAGDASDKSVTLDLLWMRGGAFDITANQLLVDAEACQDLQDALAALPTTTPAPTTTAA